MGLAAFPFDGACVSSPTVEFVDGWHLDKGKVAGGAELKLIVKKITKLASN